jgi:uncharacterized protein YutE (UPF0331/DUF86 family)
MFEKDSILSKISIIKNCLKTIDKATGSKTEALDDIIIQDAFVLNLQRSIQACIDIANIIIAKKGLKIPSTYKDSFHILSDDGIIESELKDKMLSMVGFRNIAVHDYQKLDANILKSILSKNLVDIEEFYTGIYNKLDELF